jgi:anti-sigma factor RsiW
MHNQQHPDTELLDQLRAGLLDEQPEQKSAIEQHLAVCDACRTRTEIWKQLEPESLGPRVDAGKVRTSLQAARRHALASESRGRQRVLVPVATAALLVLAVTVGIWTTQSDIDTTNTMADAGQAVPDIYEDLDFYLWLANQNEADETNPNST